ncbi:MAG TPA: hypothetical protein VE956_03765 [Nodularia sp. (in: cyanobacteria)]|nr:hypothetical protein [Nodularia sp. (in: cyanobacteria)]
MEPITAAAIATLVFSEALKEGGKTLGKGVTEQVGQLVSAIRQKFQIDGIVQTIIHRRQFKAYSILPG